MFLATHPIFGPDSASDSLKGKKIVLCKTRISNDLYKKIKDYLSKNGLNVIETTPEKHDKDIARILESINIINKDIKEVKESLIFLGQAPSKQGNKQGPLSKNKQQTGEAVQKAVQTAVQTANLDKLTVMERVVVWALLNTDLRLSYDDIAALLGKDRSTVRGQINAIKQKIPSLIQEKKEPNGKKRLFINEENKKKLAKKAKIRIKVEK